MANFGRQTSHPAGSKKFGKEIIIARQTSAEDPAVVAKLTKAFKDDPAMLATVLENHRRATAGGAYCAIIPPAPGSDVKPCVKFSGPDGNGKAMSVANWRHLIAMADFIRDALPKAEAYIEASAPVK